MTALNHATAYGAVDVLHCNAPTRKVGKEPRSRRSADAYGDTDCRLSASVVALVKAASAQLFACLLKAGGASLLQNGRFVILR